MEWETMSSPDLVNLVNELTCTLGDRTKRKTTKVLKFQLQQMEAPKQKQNPLRSPPLLQKSRTLEEGLLEAQMLQVPSDFSMPS